MAIDNNILNADLNSKISYVSGHVSVGCTSSQNANYSVNTLYDYWPHYYHSYIEKNSFEVAFKVVGKLLETKVIEKMTLKQFIETVNEVAKIV